MRSMYNNDYKDFLDDTEKMFDFITLDREDFLQCYSYLTSLEYDLTFNKFYKNLVNEIIKLDKSIQQYDINERNYYKQVLNDFFRSLPKTKQKQILNVLQEKQKKKEVNMARNLCDYGYKTIDELIQVLEHYKKDMGGDTKVYLSDFEFNGKQTQFEISKVDEEKELFIFYERHESEW